MELNYKSFGEGYPIIILHGLFGTLDNWQTIAKKLAENYLVYIVDQRNHGRSPHDTRFDYEAMADDLQVFMESQWIYEAHIIGHSMGGKTAMQFALNYPDLVNQLIVVDIAPKAYEGGHQAIFEALFSLDLSSIKNRKQADAALLAQIPDFGVRQFLLKNLTNDKKGGYKWKMNLPVIYENYQQILATIKSEDIFDNPTLFIRGGQSNYIVAEDLKQIKSLFPTAALTTVAGANHWVHAAAPKELLALVTNFLSQG
ncbi:MAG: alpha/beta fold hydrolase [Saprospiraceae bacterium]